MASGGPDLSTIETAPIYNPGGEGSGIGGLVDGAGSYSGQGAVHTGVAAGATAAAPFTYGLSLLAPLVLMGAESALGVNERDGQTSTSTQFPGASTPLVGSRPDTGGLASLIQSGGGSLRNMMNAKIYPGA